MSSYTFITHMDQRHLSVFIVNRYPCLCVWSDMNIVHLLAGFSTSRVQLFALSRPVSREAHLPASVRVRSFSETVVCFASKDGTTKEGSDGAKVCYFSRMSKSAGVSKWMNFLGNVDLIQFDLVPDRKVWLKGEGRGCQAQEVLAREAVSCAAQSVEIPALTWRPSSVSDAHIGTSIHISSTSHKGGFAWCVCCCLA